MSNMDRELKRLNHFKPILILAYADSIGILTNNEEMFHHKECLYAADENTITVYEKLDSDSNIYDGISIYFKSQIIKLSIVGNKRIVIDRDKMGRIIEVNQDDGGNTGTNKQ